MTVEIILASLNSWLRVDCNLILGKEENRFWLVVLFETNSTKNVRAGR